MFDARDHWEKLSRHMEGWQTLDELCAAAQMSAGIVLWAIEYAERHGLCEEASERPAGAAVGSMPTRLYRKRGWALAAASGELSP